jgi:hypothetical protein
MLPNARVRISHAVIDSLTRYRAPTPLRLTQAPRASRAHRGDFQQIGAGTAFGAHPNIRQNAVAMLD